MSLLCALVGALIAQPPVRVDPPEPRLGDLAVVYVASKDAQLDRGRMIAFGYETPLDRVSKTHLRGFIAVPTDTSTGAHTVEVVGAGNLSSFELIVANRSFEESELRVNRRFTKKMKPALKARIRRESAAIQALWDTEPSKPIACGTVKRPTETPITSRFGNRRVFNGKTKSVHYGLDLDGKTGDPVHAAYEGKIVMSAMRFYSGGTLVIDHGSGLFSLYFHLSRRDKKTGTEVQAGDLIGAVGKSGRVTGPHLHWAVVMRATYATGPKKGQNRSLYVDPEGILQLGPLAGGPALCDAAAQFGGPD